MRLTSEEKEILRSMGYVDWDLQQIEEASKVTSYTLCTPEERVISEMEALKFLERKTFLNGLDGVRRNIAFNTTYSICTHLYTFFHSLL